MDINSNKRKRRTRTEQEVLNNPRIKKILHLFVKSKEKILTPDLLYHEMSGLMPSKNQLNRDLTSLVNIGRLEWLERGKYKLSNRFMKDIFKTELWSCIDRLPNECAAFEDRLALFGFDLSVLPKEEAFEHNTLFDQYKEFINMCQDVAQRAEILFIQIELAYFIQIVEYNLSRLKSKEKKASLYKDANAIVNIWLTNKGINPDNPGILLNPYIKEIREQKIPNLNSIQKTKKKMSDTIFDLYFQIIVQRQMELNSTYEVAFTYCIKEDKFNLSKSDAEIIKKKLRIFDKMKLKQTDKKINCLWQPPFYLPSFTPLIVIGKDIRALDKSLFPVPDMENLEKEQKNDNLAIKK